MDTQGTLIIQGVAPEDAGNYSCQAANEMGTDEETVTLYYTGTRTAESAGQTLLSLPPTNIGHLLYARPSGYSSEHMVPD